MIHVIAVIRTKPSRRTEFLKEFQRIVPAVRAEAGCIEYGPALDIATSIPGLPAVRDDVVTVVEKWENIPALDAHLKAPHMLTYREAVKDMLADVEIRVLAPVT